MTPIFGFSLSIFYPYLSFSVALFFCKALSAVCLTLSKVQYKYIYIFNIPKQLISNVIQMECLKVRKYSGKKFEHVVLNAAKHKLTESGSKRS